MTLENRRQIKLQADTSQDTLTTSEKKRCCNLMHERTANLLLAAIVCACCYCPRIAQPLPLSEKSMGADRWPIVELGTTGRAYYVRTAYGLTNAQGDTLPAVKVWEVIAPAPVHVAQSVAR
jgi:hypothetical protein